MPGLAEATFEEDFPFGKATAVKHPSTQLLDPICTGIVPNSSPWWTVKRMGYS
jgi:hypothetical protein